MKLRVAKSEDAKQLVEIYKFYVENTDITFEYEVPTVEEFAQRIKKTLLKYPYIVLEKDDIILGYAYASAFKERKAYDWSVETSIYVKDGERGGGIGTLLYNELERYLIKQNIINVNACITHPNKKSELFHKKFGYKKVAHFTKCGYKFGVWKDMIWMEKFIGEHKDKPEEIIAFSKLKL